MARPCSIAGALGVLGEKWSLLVVRELVYGRYRFAEIAEATGAPRDILTSRLRRLAEHGVIERVRYQYRPERYEYRLTAAGLDLAPVLVLLAQWGDRWATDGLPPVEFRHREHRLEPTLGCAECGEPVHGEDLAARSEHADWPAELHVV